MVRLKDVQKNGLWMSLSSGSKNTEETEGGKPCSVPQVLGKEETAEKKRKKKQQNVESLGHLM